jgi:hypothetical protein
MDGIIEPALPPNRRDQRVEPVSFPVLKKDLICLVNVIGFLKINEAKLRSGATSLFDVQRWTFNVRCSFF